jgi:hypothetical protein
MPPRPVQRWKEWKVAARKTDAKAEAKKPAVRRRRKVTQEMIEERAYFIALSGMHGSPVDHWLTAERELLIGA